MVTLWIIFLLLVIILLALDLGVFHRKAEEVTVGSAMKWSAVWISLGLSFSVFIFFGYSRHWFGLGGLADPVDGGFLDGNNAVIKYLTGYVIEKSLSIDNIFVIAMIFGSFSIPRMYQHRILFWGIFGALVMRGAMIALGSEIVTRFHWTLYVFGVLLLITGMRMLLAKEGGRDIQESMVLRLIKKILPVTPSMKEGKFLIKQRARPHSGKIIWMITPLGLALVVIEATDLIFAVDSIPAIFAVTADPFIVFTSNVFAILGLRSLYFALSGLLQKFRYLKISLSLILLLVGLKMLFSTQLKTLLGENFNLYLLAIVILILAAGILGSLLTKSRKSVD